jgi:negative regulator of sigma E activity
MSEELLSALLDGECSPAEAKRLLEQLEGSPALRRRWSRMCLTRDAVDGTRVEAASIDFCAGVMAAIEREKSASVAASQPQPAARLGKAKPATVVPLRRADAAARAWQPVAGLAMAASIAAVVAVGGYRWLSAPVAVPGAAALVSPASTGSVAEAGGLQTVALAGTTQGGKLVQVSTAAAEEPAETSWSQLDADTARQLSEYMMEHSNLRAAQGVGGALSYPRMMVRPADYRTGEPH